MHSSLGVLSIMLALAGTSGCGVRVLERWAGSEVAKTAVPAPADALMARMATELRELGLLVEEVRPDERLIQLAWLTRSGDGRQYLTCETAGPVGSASLRPRVQIVPLDAGSQIVVSTEVRSTVAAACHSNGRFEQWLLERLQPAVAAAAAEAAGEVRSAPE